MRAAAAAVEAFDVLSTYFETPVPGLWRDRRLAEGGFVDEPAPASSFYHIMVAFNELIGATQGEPQQQRKGAA